MKNLPSIVCTVFLGLLAGCATAPEPGGGIESYRPTLIHGGPKTQVKLIDAGNGQRLVRAEVNGHAGVFAIDSGADYTILTPQFAQEAGLSGGATSGWLKEGDARKKKVQFTKITALTVGDISFLGFYAPIVDVSHINRAMRTELSGILGNNVLRETTFKFDWKQGVLALDTGTIPPPAGSIPIYLRGNRIYMTATVNGQFAEFALDTGAYHSLIDEKEIPRLRIPDNMKSRVGMMQVDIAGSRRVEQTQVTVESFKLGGIERTGYAMPTWTHNVIGMDLLEPWVVTVDCRNAWMTLTAPPAQ